MEFLIKQEPNCENFPLIIKQLSCCSLCSDGEDILKDYIQHHHKNHFRNFDQHPDAFEVQSTHENVPRCECPESIALQTKLLAHLIAKLMPKALNLNENDITSLPQTIVIEPVINIQVKQEDVKNEEELDDESYVNQDDFNYDESDTESESDLVEEFFKELPLVSEKSSRRKTRSSSNAATGPQKPSNASIKPEQSSADIKRPKLKPIAPLVPCNFCPKSLSTTKWLEKHHDKFHNQSNKFKCKKCSNGHCKTIKNLNAHLRLHDEHSEDFDELHRVVSSIPAPIFSCDHCDSKYASKILVYRHLRVTHFKMEKKHHSVYRKKPKNRIKVLCQYCSVCISNDNLARHIKRFHSDDSEKFEFKCDVNGCGKGFTTRSMLRDHKNLHTGLKPYICSYCGVSFSHNAVLRRHKYRHINPEKYKCEVCSECFVTGRGLQNHVQRIHTDAGNDAKPFACDFEGCTAAFKYEVYLQTHKREVHLRKNARARVRNKNKLKKGKWRLQHEIDERKAEIEFAMNS